jgi:general secretion pathway protein L
MLQSGQNWEIFGYDMRQVGRHWLAAWRGFLFAYDSPLRARLDELVVLRGEAGEQYYQGGAASAQGDSNCSAILLPDDLVLSRQLRLPAAVEGDLESALALEVNANSPFKPGDTGWGWQVVARDENFIQVALVIVSPSAVMTYLAHQFDVHDIHAQEIWADVNSLKVVVRGFGERIREKRYQKRLLRSVVLVLIAAALLLGVVGVSVLSKRLELRELQGVSAAIQRESAEASRMRNSLATANEAITTANQIMALHPDPHAEIARLTRLLGDDASLVQFTMIGKEIRIRGRAADAAAVMQQLTDEADYAEVTAPQAITRLGNTGLEQFYLNIRLRDAVPR